MDAKRTAVIALTVALALGDASASARTRPVDLAAGVRPVRLVAAPAYVRRACERSRLLPPTCPYRLPYVGREPAWDVQVCLRGKQGCLGLTWDDLELQHVDYGPLRPPTWSHVAIFAGRLEKAFPFRYPKGGKSVPLRDGLFARTRSRALSFGATRWGTKTGTLVLAPGYPRGGEQGDHLVFRWSSFGIGYAIGLHAWEPLTEAVATLRAIVLSAGSRAAIGFRGARLFGPAPAPSHPLGLPWAGGLAGGVRLPASGRHFFTWDPVLRRSPDRPWRRYGTDRLMRLVLSVIDRYGAAHPRAARVGIGDLSRPRGGDFGLRYGWPGHVSHQNGLDVDVYYPRRDRRERPPGSPTQIARLLAQDLVDRFVRAGATRIFVGPHTGLTGPPQIVQILANHDNHLHVRIAAPPPRWRLLGRSQDGRPILVAERGNPHATRILVVGCIHGDECAGRAVVRLLALMPEPLHRDLWLVDAGPRPLSERETRVARKLIRRLRPAITIWFDQPQVVVRAWGHSVATALRLARLAGVSVRRLRRRSFVVEVPPGPLAPAAASRYARAVIAVA